MNTDVDMDRRSGKPHRVKRVGIHVRIDPQTRDELHEKAERLGMSLTELLVEAAKSF